MYQRLILTLSPAEQAALTKLSEMDMRPPREQLRYLLREAASERGLWPIPQEKPSQVQQEAANADR